MASSTPRSVSQIVAIGSSAGGIETLSTLVATLPADFPAPLVIAQHLDPSRASHLQEILARRSRLPVRTVVDQEVLEPGVVYVVPSNGHVSLSDHHLSIGEEGATRPKPSIDLLFRSAAAVFGEGLIAVVLSGLGSDGAVGARRVKEAGGTVVIQNPRTAPYPSMPRSLAPTTVDVVADVDAMGPLLYDLLTGAYTPVGPSEDRQLRTFLNEVRDRSGIDFSQYKEPTIQRRLQRRLLATGTRSLAAYRDYLQDHPEEYDRLVNAFLIKVTAFFRDADLFTYLRTVVVPSLVEEGRMREKTLRLWSAGCATGEEAYSLALLIAEALGDEVDEWTVRIFATDLDGAAVDFARRGTYPLSVLEAVPPALLARYFTSPEDGSYVVNKTVRGLLVFGEHDLGQRPPFPRVDLCLCRNVLIYFTPELQQRTLELFAFALRDGGYLALGKAETSNLATDYFTPVSAAVPLHLYRRQGGRLIVPQLAEGTQRTLSQRGRVEARPSTLAAQELARVREDAQRAVGAQLAAEQLLLRLPVGVAVVDRRYDIQRINEAGRRLLGISEAALGEDLTHLVRGLTVQGQHDLRAAIDAALRGEDRILESIPSMAIDPGTQRILRIDCARYRIGREGAAMLGVLEGRRTAGDELALLTVSDVTEAVEARKEAARLQGAVVALQETVRELRLANEDLSTATILARRTSEESVLSNEEMQAAAEEVETLNEELQASNEELETLNEELQASNEELETTNDELRARQRESEELASTVEAQRQRLAAILGSLGEAVVVLDRTGDVAFVNARFDEMFGPVDGAFRAEDAEGRPLPRDATPQERARRGETFQMTFTRMGTGTDATRHWFEATGNPILSAEEIADAQLGEFKNRDGVLVIRDITDRTLRRLQDSFLAVASHELRTPLTPISGYLQMLERGLKAESLDPRRLVSYVSSARSEMRRLQRLVEDLLDVSRLEGGPLRLQRARMDLTAVVDRAVEKARMLGDGQTVRLVWARSEEKPLWVDGDAVRLEQVVLNLLTNAVTHAPGASIEMHARRVEGMVELTVSDDGPGIPLDAQPHLFTRFYQARQEQSNGAGGLGLGLFITREIVEAHGGTITLASTLGQGVTFTVRLPLTTDEQ